MEFFTHPWYMAAGGLLISSPILIHLINRMRFKRIRWAAMEFLLKSQKRNQRKLIIEQMILLLLRILLVLLAAFLVARFLYGASTTRGAHHVVIVDDSLSLFDRDQEGGKDRVAYETAIEQIKSLARNAAEAPSVQNMKIFLLSEIAGSPLFEGRLGNRSVDDIDSRFATRLRKPSLLHLQPLVALQKGRQFLGDTRGEGQKILHFVSDFRDHDWAGSDADKLLDEIKSILDAGINLNMIDVATPLRTSRSKEVGYHNNIALVDVKAESRVAIEDADLEFTAIIKNLGTAKDSKFLKVYVNGEHDLTRDMMIENIAPGEIKEHKFTLRFNRRTRPGMEISEKDSPEERERKRRLEREQFHIRVTLGKEDAGLNADNVRDLVVEVRKKVPTLVIDGNRPEVRGDGSDMHILQSFYAGSGVYEVEERRISDLEKADLDLYPSVILLNVPELPEAAIKKLKAYIDNGGSVCWFLGEEVKADHYNSVLFKSGIFPLLLKDRPFDPLAAAGMIDPEQRQKERARLRQTTPTPKILFPRADHPLTARLAPYVSFFRYLSMNVYWQADDRSRWDPDGRQTESLIVMPNTQSALTYQNRAIQLVQAAQSQTTRLADKEAEFKRYLPVMEQYFRDVRETLSRQDLYRLGEKLEDLLTNQGVKDDARKPNMTDLWKHDEMKGLAAEIREFRDKVLYGDPLLVTRQAGKGRVVAYLSSVGTIQRRGVGEDSVQWNNWAAGEQAIAPLYPPFLIGLHNYLVSEGQAPNRLLGESLNFTLDASRYAPQYSWSFVPQPDVNTDEDNRTKPETEKGPLTKSGNQLNFSIDRILRPGTYRINLTLIGEGPEEDRQEVRAIACNVDTVESDLKRANRDRMQPELPSGDSKRGQLTFRVAGESLDTFKERQPDASESSMLYLFFILILVVEQAMAVHLSFHTRAGEQGATGPRAEPARAA